MATRADLIRDVKKPGCQLKKLLDHGMTWEEVLAKDPDMLSQRTVRLKEHMNSFRPITHVQSNSMKIGTAWLDFPNAKQMDYDGKILNIYTVGHRELNSEEQRAFDEWKAITQTEKYKQDAHYDAMTDYSGTFYQEKRFYADKGLPYMFDYKGSGGKAYVSYYVNLKGERIEGNFIRDNSLRGEKIFAYEIKFN